MFLIWFFALAKHDPVALAQGEKLAYFASG
jgi:hypothetical protein